MLVCLLFSKNQTSDCFAKDFLLFTLTIVINWWTSVILKRAHLPIVSLFSIFIPTQCRRLDTQCWSVSQHSAWKTLLCIRCEMKGSVLNSCFRHRHALHLMHQNSITFCVLSARKCQCRCAISSSSWRPACLRRSGAMLISRNLRKMLVRSHSVKHRMRASAV